VEYTQTLLKEIGLEPERLEMLPIGASDAPAWVRAVDEMTSRAQKLGANPLKKT
jgi:coenzyme F420-reducing hydrogenase delta subunit